MLLGNGDGTFSANNIQLASSYAAAGDLNGDGTPDVVGLAGNILTVLHGLGTGSFQTVATYPLPAEGSGVLIADMNGDGKLDIVATGTNRALVLMGNGDGTFQPPLTYFLTAEPKSIVAGDFNGDGRTDLGLANVDLSSLSVIFGILSPVLEVTSTHAGNFNSNSTGVYTLTVTNQGLGGTSATVRVDDGLPAGMNGVQMSGTGWLCTVAILDCTRTDVLAAGASYPPISLSVSVGPNVSSPAVNVVSVSGGGAVAGANGSDSTIVNSAPPFPALTYPPNGATAISVTADPNLNWSASTGASSYDVYLGTSASPGFVANVTGTSYPASAPVNNQTYYWQVVAKNASGSNPSAIWSFTTVASITTASSIWSSLAVPQNPLYSAPPVTLGTKFQSDVSGNITAIRFYKGAGNNGTHIGLLYSSSGTLLAQATFTGETASGWQQVNLSAPVAIAANTVYIVAYFSSSGFAYDANYFANNGVYNPPLRALQYGANGPNGVCSAPRPSFRRLTGSRKIIGPT